jgi:hypothetical protein
MTRTCLLILCVLLLGRFAPANAQRQSAKPAAAPAEASPTDAAYSEKIKEYTDAAPTNPRDRELYIDHSRCVARCE